MSAYFESGFCVRTPSWHGMEDLLDEYPEDWADARAKAKMLWEPEERAMFQRRSVDDFETGQLDLMVQAGGAYVIGDQAFVLVPDHKLIVRNDSELVLGTTSEGFAAIYHGNDGAEHASRRLGEERASMEEIIDAFKGSDGKVKFETAGVLREGRSVWALLYIDEPYTLPGDTTEHLPFVAILNDHSANGSCRLINTQVRVVCWNTWQAAINDGERSGRQFTFRHVGDVKGRIEEAKEAIAGLRGETEQYMAMAAELSTIRVDDERLANFLHDFLPEPSEHGRPTTDRVKENVAKARSMFKSMYLESVTLDGIRGTGFGLLQASTEYLDHVRGFRSQETYLGRSVLRPEPAKAKALQLVRGLGK